MVASIDTLMGGSDGAVELGKRAPIRNPHQIGPAAGQSTRHTRAGLLFIDVNG